MRWVHAANVLRRFLVVVCALGAVGAAKAQVPAPSLVTSTIDGHKLVLRDLRGKFVLVTFWATTCTICLAEQPDLVKTYERYRPRGLEVVAVAMPYDRPELIKQHLAKYPMPFPVVWDKDGQIGRQFLGILGTPTTFIVDKSGRLVSKTVGAIDFEKLRHFLDGSLS